VKIRDGGSGCCLISRSLRLSGKPRRISCNNNRRRYAEKPSFLELTGGGAGCQLPGRSRPGAAPDGRAAPIATKTLGLVAGRRRLWESAAARTPWRSMATFCSIWSNCSVERPSVQVITMWKGHLQAIHVAIVGVFDLIRIQAHTGLDQAALLQEQTALVVEVQLSRRSRPRCLPSMVW